jgi:hypothetical protein
MTKKFWYFLAFLIVGMLVAIAAWKYTFKKSESSVASRKTDITIEASLLLQAFESNEDSANVRYLDKILQVSGTIESVLEDSLGYSVYLKEKDALSGIMCSFSKSAFDPALIKTGSQAAIKGLCTGYLLDVVLNKCSVVSQAEN